MKQNKKTPSAKGALITLNFKDQKFSAVVDEIHPQEHQKILLQLTRKRLRNALRKFFE